jgi:O-antigen/teichoic acid export membrane protein/tRNA A-37 threonylcarbamoyl transferase component Bud32
MAPEKRYAGRRGALDYDLKSSLPIAERAPAQLSAPPPFGQRCVAITADPCTAQEETRWWWVSLLRTAWENWRTHVLALADQAVVSAASFLTTVVIARWTIPNELGLYSIGISLLVSSVSIQESMISLPYTIQQHRAPGTPAEHAGSSLTHSTLLSALGVVILVVTALALSASNAEPQLRAMTWTLAGVLPFAFLREFARKFSLAHLHTGEVLILDSAVAAIQLAGLGWIGWTGRMSSATACVALGVACASGAIVWLCLSRGKFSIRRDHVLKTARQSWGLGKWLFAGQITVSVQGYMAYWLLALLVGAAATGVFAACMSIVSFGNPLITGLSNIMTPRAVLALKDGGGVLLRRQIIRDALLLGAAMTLFCMVALFVGDDVMRLLYHGREYEGQGHTVTVLAIALLASAVGTPASNALAGMERPRAIVWAGSVGVVLTAVLVWFLIIEWGLVGAAYGFLLGNVAAAVGRWVAFLTLVSGHEPERDPVATPSDSAPLGVIGVLQHFTQNGKDADWIIEALGEGDQANVHCVRSRSRHQIWQTHPALVIKLYKPELAPEVEVVRRQFEALSRLRVVLHGHTINGWKISSPAPLYVCVSPLALVMTMVPGRPLTSLLDDADNMTPGVLDSAARAVAAAMERCWSLGQVHGDLNIDNILCDIPNRRLSFVDLGLPRNSFPVGDDVSRCWYPASQDLAYMLYDTGVRVKSTIGNSEARLRQQLFAESTLRAFMETIGPFEEKQRLLNEIEACTRVFLESLCPSSSPRELRRMMVRRIAARRIDAILLRLRARLSHLDRNQLRNSKTSDDFCSRAQ